MKTIIKHGSYEVLQYDENLITIDFINEHIGVTVKAFTTKEKALKVFNDIIKPLPLRKAYSFNDDIRKSIIYSD